MKKMLITGGTVFVSRYAAQYFAKKYDVYVLNRNTRPQCDGVTLIEGDRNCLTDQLRGVHFDVVLDITAYNEKDVGNLLDALDSFDDYILISSSAVYPEDAPQPFTEETPVGSNKIWGQYGADKIAAERLLLSRVPNAYILRPPYLYGPGNNVYREAFVFDCIWEFRKFCLPGDGSMKLQFFHVEDLCRFMELLLEQHPARHIFNVGNKDSVTIKEWVSLCYRAANREAEYRYIGRDVPQRNYFPFHDYEYSLSVEAQDTLMPDTKDLLEGLRESFEWYLDHTCQVRKKPLLKYIDKNIKEIL